VYEMLGRGQWSVPRGSNAFDGGAPYYDVYETADDRLIALGCVEQRFYHELLRLLELDDPELADPTDPARWPAIRSALTTAFRQRSADGWEAHFDGTEVCFSVVADVCEAPAHPHNEARQTFYDADGMALPAPAPRFLGTPPELPRGPRPAGTETRDALAAWGF